MRVRLIVECDTTGGMQPAGTVIEHPHAYRLCELGFAEPADDEARAKHAEFLGRGGLVGENAGQVEPPQEAD